MTTLTPRLRPTFWWTPAALLSTCLQVSLLTSWSCSHLPVVQRRHLILQSRHVVPVRTLHINISLVENSIPGYSLVTCFQRCLWVTPINKRHRKTLFPVETQALCQAVKVTTPPGPTESLLCVFSGAPLCTRLQWAEIESHGAQVELKWLFQVQVKARAQESHPINPNLLTYVLIGCCQM